MGRLVRRSTECPDCGHENILGTDECDSCGAALARVEELKPRTGIEKRIIEGAVGDLSPRHAVSLGPDDSALAAIERMRHHKIGCVLIEKDGRYLGMISEREILYHAPLAKTDLARTKLRSLVWSDSGCLNDTDELAWAFNRMALSAHLHIAVKLSKGGMGVVSARDLLKYLCR
jgi:CBS domain-containing protein